MKRYHIFTHRKFLQLFIIGVFLLSLSLVINFYAGNYATEKASAPVTDIVLSNTRVYDFDWVFVYGAIAFWIFISVLLFRDPHRIPFVLSSVALFIIIRSLFVSVTHIGPFPGQLIVESNLLNKLTFAGDLFFSGHTGLPFLMALVFWDNLRIRFICIISAVMFGIAVLLAHIHYSIDVLSAFFITYGIYRMAELFFKESHRIFKNGVT
ncbi:MAG: hypothetical protein HZC03_02355 [Candidatus Lloydbacteria bacterium]|nr:hypothetical protein [Candidatus Lloydbacteria bacterium]